jgi:pyruvate ferredoxin oxidoreductase gamma subunit
LLKEIRFHGRGGQGAVTSSQTLATAAFTEGKYSQAFPNFGVERRGAPVLSFTRIDDRPINVRSQIYEPDYVIVLDASLVANVDVSAGIKPDGVLIINSNKAPEQLGIKGSFKAYSFDVTKVAMDVIGKPFVNIASLGAFAALTGEVKLDSLKKAVNQTMGKKGPLAEINNKALEEIYNGCIKLKGG